MLSISISETVIKSINQLSFRGCQKGLEGYNWAKVPQFFIASIKLFSQHLAKVPMVLNPLS